MSDISPIPRLLDQLDALKAAGQDFATREEKLNREHRARLGTAQQQLETAHGRLNDDVGDKLDDVRDDYEASRKANASWFAARKRRINRAHANVRKLVLDDVANADSRQKYAIQKGTLDAERTREAALAQAVANHAEYQQRLVNLQADFAQLGASAQSAFGSYGKFRRQLSPDRTWPEPDLAPDESQLFERLQKIHTETTEDIARFRKNPLTAIFRFFPFWVVLILTLAAIVNVVFRIGKFGGSVGELSAHVPGWVNILIFFLPILREVGADRQQSALATKIAAALALARRLDAACFDKSNARLVQDQARVQTDYQDTVNSLNLRWRNLNRETIQERGDRPVETDAQAQRIYQKCEQLQVRQLQKLEQDEKEALALLQLSKQTHENRLNTEHAAQTARLERDFQASWQTLVSEWTALVPPTLAKIHAHAAQATQYFPAWSSPEWNQWTPLQSFRNLAQFGHLDVNLAQLAGSLPKDARLAVPGGTSLSVPLVLDFPAHGSLLFETPKEGGDEAIAAINNLIFRVLSSAPPGKVNFTIIDPVGLGQNFAALMHLADYEEGSINSRIWTQPAQIEERLGELSDHMEKVIQMYLRNDYATITEYNAHAGNLAEKYHFLVIASFPANFTENATRRLRNIAASGARCGVFTLIHWDQRLAVTQDFVPDELRQNSVNLVRADKSYELAGWRRAGVKVVLDTPPAPEVATQFLHQVGRSSKNSTRVEVPFAQITPKPEEIWTWDTGSELRVPIGRSGATKLQYLELGKATRQHALIAGKTGSGKSTLFHVIITNLALFSSPDEVEFYLVDFKKGVEFKCYGTRKLPHAKVVAIESDREFGLSVLQRVDDELRRRGDLFRQLGVQDVAGYRRAGGGVMPRALLMIDEFQEFFTEEDRISQGAAVLLDRIVRQGRAFGIHVILGSQTLGGAYTLARATIGQMVVRIALQCNEADAYLIMDQDNPAPRLLSRPGEGIYNDAAGMIEGNSPFQAVWLAEEVRDNYLAQIRARADASGKQYAEPFVFEGNAPADVRENLPLRALLDGTGGKPAFPARVWLGAPNAIKGPTEAVFPRQSGSNLLLVGQAEERTATMFVLSLIALSAQFPKDGAIFYVLDSTPPGFPQREFLESVLTGLPQKVVTPKDTSLEDIMTGLAETLKQRADGQADAPEIFLFIQGLQQFKRLRAEDEFSFSSSTEVTPAATFTSLISEGPARGIHVIAACDTYNNVTRFIGRKLLGEFEMRVLFQVSASDSAGLIDSPDASTLGLHRALFHHDREGYNETFRPYARPADDWLRAALKRLTPPPTAT